MIFSEKIIQYWRTFAPRVQMSWNQSPYTPPPHRELSKGTKNTISRNPSSVDLITTKQKQTTIYEGRCFVLLCFCTYEIHRAGMLQIVFLVSLESSWGEGVHQLGFMTFGLAVQKFLNIEWLPHPKSLLFYVG